jgi:hypothetical protein
MSLFSTAKEAIGLSSAPDVKPAIHMLTARRSPGRTAEDDAVALVNTRDVLRPSTTLATGC